jgi:hypothetical protein
LCPADKRQVVQIATNWGERFVPDKQRGKPFNYKSVRAMID